MVMLGLVIRLIADNGWMIFDVPDQCSDDALGVEKVGRIGDIHYLAGAVSAWPLRRDSQHVGMLLDHPGWNRVGWRPDDDADAGLIHGIQDTVDRSKVEHTVLGLMGAPGRFGDPDYIDPNLFQHPDIFI